MLYLLKFKVGHFQAQFDKWEVGTLSMGYFAGRSKDL